MRIVDEVRGKLDTECCGSNSQFDRFERAWDAEMSVRATDNGVVITATEPEAQRSTEYHINGVDGIEEYDSWLLIAKLFRHLRVRSALIEVLGDEYTTAARGAVLVWDIKGIVEGGKDGRE